jgi:hypothetical protein
LHCIQLHCIAFSSARLLNTDECAYLIEAIRISRGCRPGCNSSGRSCPAGLVKTIACATAGLGDGVAGQMKAWRSSRFKSARFISFPMLLASVYVACSSVAVR